ncbi:MAG: hypothetical protein PWQ37_2308 [Candidatus Petromonas sp.]|jgi:hypothetical protein|nr:hypothetical protein [Candidatus Petromonas sp.]
MDTRIFDNNSNKPKMNKFKDKEIINRIEIEIALRIPYCVDMFNNLIK